MTMTGPGTRRGAPAATPTPPPMPAVRFIDGTYEYSEIIATYTVTPGAAAQDLPITNITPGGFLRGVSLIVTSTAGVIGTGAVSADNPFSLFGPITFESIDGTPILYPMSGYAHYLASRFTRSWDGDPALDTTFSATVNPSFRLRVFAESRATLAALPNTDARAQYRLRINVNPFSGTNPESALLTTLGTATAPTVTVLVQLETYAQPPARTLSGVPIQQIPDGVGMQRFLSQQLDVVGSGNNIIKENRTGNLIRTFILVFRSSAGVRTDLTTDPIRLRVDNTQLFVETRAHRDLLMWLFYQMQTSPGAAVSRPTGVYVFPRWQVPGDMRGQAWLETTESTFVQFEVNGAPAAGSMQTITEDLAPVGPLPQYLENIQPMYGGLKGTAELGFMGSGVGAAAGVSARGSLGTGAAPPQPGGAYTPDVGPAGRNSRTPAAHQMLLVLVGLEVAALLGLRHAFRNHHGG